MDLIESLIRSAIEKEKAWQEIEQRPDFKDTFNNRTEAHNAFLKVSFAKAAK